MKLANSEAVSAQALVILSAAKDLIAQSNTGTVEAAVRSFASLRTTESAQDSYRCFLLVARSDEPDRTDRDRDGAGVAGAELPGAARLRGDPGVVHRHALSLDAAGRALARALADLPGEPAVAGQHLAKPVDRRGL